MTIGILGALIGAGASIASSFLGANAAQEAADQQAAAIKRAEREQRAVRQELRDLFGGEIGAGNTGREALLSLLGFRGPQAQQQLFGQALSNPARQGLRQDNINAVQGTAAAGGRLFSGGTLSELSSRLQNIDNALIGNFQNSLAGLQNSGNQARSALGSGLTGTGNNLSNLAVNLGQARAGGTIGTANAFTGGLQNLSDIFFSTPYSQSSFGNQLQLGGLY